MASHAVLLQGSDEAHSVHEAMHTLCATRQAAHRGVPVIVQSIGGRRQGPFLSLLQCSAIQPERQMVACRPNGSFVMNGRRSAKDPGKIALNGRLAAR